MTLRRKSSESKSHSVMSDTLQHHGVYSPWNSPGQNTGVGSISLFQGIFSTQDQTLVFSISGGFFTIWATREDLITYYRVLFKPRETTPNSTWSRWKTPIKRNFEIWIKAINIVIFAYLNWKRPLIIIILTLHTVFYIDDNL